MSIRIIQERLDSYNCKSRQEEENAIREITQEVALNALYNADFFKVAALHGGTYLRIFHSLNRFSEDLDFALIKPDPDFSVNSYLASLSDEFKSFGYGIEVVDRTKVSQAVRKIFIKDDSIGQILKLDHPNVGGRPKAIKIKLEVDTNPPLGARFENKFHDFPLNFAVTAHDLPSLFAGKSHAMLCRKYTKGRDWYDFLWYVSKKISINYELLSNAINQLGPWSGQKIGVDKAWYLKKMEEVIGSIDWKEAANEVSRFLKPNEVRSLELWKTGFFLSKLEKLAVTDVFTP